MADYITLQDAIDAGITNMTVLRNNSGNDDGTSTYATGIDWFKFNNVTVSNIYSSGNSWIGLGASSEQLKVNRQDCKVWYEYKETGTIGITRFFKFRWVGYSYYSQTGSAYLQGFDVFLLETGQIFLNFYQVPTSNYSGTNSLVANSTVTFSITAGTPCEYTFTPSDATTGTGFTVSTERPDIDVGYKSSGTAVFTLNYTVSGNDTLIWTATVPEDTSIVMATSVNGGSYTNITNNSVISGLPSVGTSCTLRVRATLSTSDTAKTPMLNQVRIASDADKQILVLGLAVPNISSAIGDVGIAYDGLAGLRGRGGPVAAFDEDYTPTGLTWKGHQNEEEHIEMSMSANVNLRQVTYYNTQETEHIEMSMSATVTLTHINDL